MVWTDILNAWGAAVIGGFFGSAGGAWGAQRIAEKSAKRKDAIAELRNVNAALQLAFSICNTALAYRKQFSKPLMEKIKQDREDFEVVRTIKLRQGDEFYLQMDLRKFQPPVIPINSLRDIVYSKISAVGKMLSATAEIESAHSGLIEANRQRDAFIDQATGGGTDPFVYLGFRNNGGILDERYYTWVCGLDQYASDIAFFSLVACRDLETYGDIVRKKLVALHGGRDEGIPRVSAIDFSGAEASGLLPAEKDYEKWTRGFTDVAIPVVDSSKRHLWWGLPGLRQKRKVQE